MATRISVNFSSPENRTTVCALERPDARALRRDNLIAWAIKSEYYSVTRTRAEGLETKK